MKRGVLLFLCLSALILLAPSLLCADEQTENLVSHVLESFDPETRTTDWLVQGSKFVTEGFPKQTYVKAWPEALYGANREGLDLQALGAYFKFDRKGYNYIEFIPVTQDENGDTVPNPISIPGRVKNIDLWAWGSDFDYYLEVHIMDPRGVVHVLNLGSLNYTGWKNLTVDIPSYIPQSRNYAPYLEGLQLVKVVLWTKPLENVNDCYFYLDQIKVLTDVFVSRFDGDELTDPEKVDEVWGGVE
ncbi:flagellar filament outer layer protein FlaA [Sediminispirochaeta smaragdinae]|jgi:hypothetical protein|uniref:Flagellar filament outer layer protein FlaA n=1 Tax=Sediminispirochaeta smaragdinae (strain DSM 11293 / JCM 15392 / SEBR 4228) TaxID=573413 RepID=E1R4F6_SEDSS|nr:flagellar filament outer layer protein FlaA [Sediminispirochaeta smaragdinae]ADK81697.1 flagellar filament outer layer protein FlaA [Sediminispirochaeta smaragdinae DSM 11293]